MNEDHYTINHFVFIVTENVPKGTTDPGQVIRHSRYQDSQGNSVPADSTPGKTLETVVAPGDNITFFFSPNLTNSGLAPNSGHIVSVQRVDGGPDPTGPIHHDSNNNGSITVTIPSDAPNTNVDYGLKVNYMNGDGTLIENISFDPVIQVRSSGN